MNRILYLLVGLAILGLSSYYFFTESSNNKLSKIQSNLKITDAPAHNSNVDYHGGFAIFTNGTFRIFTASMYHNRSTNVYIENPNPNIVYVKKRGTTWSDFFSTLPIKLTKGCLTTGTKQMFCTSGSSTLKFFLNGVRDDNLLDREIKDGDKALISYGPEDEDVKNQFLKIPNPR